MINALNYGSPIRLAQLTGTDPSGGEGGGLYYDEDGSKIRVFQNSAWDNMADEGWVANELTSYYTKTDADLEFAAIALETTVGTINSPTNYTAASNVVGIHLDGINTELGLKADLTYVASISAGLDPKQAVRTATTADLGLDTNAYADGSAESGFPGVGATLTGPQAVLVIDGITVAEGERVLVKDQADLVQNGIYTLTTVGDVGTAWVLTRATDLDGSPANELDGGEYTYVQGGGTSNAGTAWVVINPAGTAIAVGSGDIEWSQSGGVTTLQTAYDGGQQITTDSATNVIIAGLAGLEVSADEGVIISGGSLDMKDQSITTSTANDIIILPNAANGVMIEGSGDLYLGVSSDQAAVANASNKLFLQSPEASGQSEYIALNCESASLLVESDGTVEHKKEFISKSLTQLASTTVFLATAGGSYTLEYKMTNVDDEVRTGRLLCAVDAGSAVSLSDDYVETADLGITWSVSGLEIQADVEGSVAVDLWAINKEVIAV